ncbi:MAG TPA: FG-GAP repeat protein, partial [Blastocatellia bacterium]|nr:FG-GAP repeat protein [Blastocatellia bacterium]
MRTSVYKITIIALMAVANMLVLPLRNTVIYSQSVRQLPTRIRVEDTPADITIIGGVSRIVGSGDFNGDGVEDFLVEYRKLISEDTGTVVFIKFGMIFGKRNQTTPVKIDTSKDEPDLSLTTSVKGILGTFSIAKLGDLNDDGIDDLVLSQQLFGEIGKPGDRVFKILFGSQRFQSGVIDLDGLQPDLKIIADRGVSATGIAGVADVDGDGVRDILLTENAYYTNFALPILSGPFTTGQTIDLNSQQPDAIIRATNRYDRVTGAYLADLNGDALTDMLVRKSKLDSLFGFSASLDIVFGSPDLKGGVEVSLSDGPAGASVGVGSDSSAIATGDVNHDGIDDILVGEPYYAGEPAPPPWFSGSVFIILGSRVMRGTVNRTDEFILGIPPPNPFHPIYQTTLGDRLGASLAVSDINGDGAPDILIGAPGLTSDKKGRVTNLSRVHVILGSTETKSDAQIDTAQSQQDITIS